MLKQGTKERIELMNPQDNYGFPVTPEDPGDTKFKKRLRLLGILAAIMVVVFIVLIIISNRKPLTITSYNPTLSVITTQAPTLKLTFNMPLVSTSASVTSNPSIITSSNVSGNTLTLNLKARTMLILHTYTITIKSLQATTGQKLVNKVVSFSPKFATPFVTGEEGLKSIGLTDQQVADINNYNAQLSPWAQTVEVDTGSIKHYMLNPSDPWSPWAVSFTESIDGYNYNVVGSFYNTQDIQVQITDPSTNTQVLNAGSPGSV
jgi:hypothetical protein